MSTNLTSLYVQKVKFKHLGKVGFAQFKWNINNGRYTPVMDALSQPEWDNSSHLSYQIPSVVNDTIDFESDNYRANELFNNIKPIDDQPF